MAAVLIWLLNRKKTKAEERNINANTENLSFDQAIVIGNEHKDIAKYWKDQFAGANKTIEDLKKLVEDQGVTIREMNEKIEILLRRDFEKTKTIEDQRRNLLRWEDNSVRLGAIIKEKDRQISDLFKELESKE